jgi:hypothetical protein
VRTPVTKVPADAFSGGSSAVSSPSSATYASAWPQLTHAEFSKYTICWHAEQVEMAKLAAVAANAVRGAPAGWRSDTLEGQVGKEWWVSSNWGLGLAGRALLGAMKDRPLVNENVTTWRLAAFSLLFSATYN